MISYLIYPLLMGSALYASVELMQGSLSPANAALISTILFGFIAIPILEYFFPYRTRWNQSHKDFKLDTIYMLLNAAIPKLWTPIQLYVITLLAIALSVNTNGLEWWPSDGHWSMELFLMLLIAEFGRYWVHFAAHKVKWLWRFHAVHHSSKRLYFLNANRFHPLEKLLFQIPEVAPFIILGTPVEIIALYFTFNSIHGLTQHSNIKIKGGVLNYIFSLTELHRWHHSKVIAESDTNFGNNLIIWDIVFGTFYLPKSRAVDNIGLINTTYPQTWIAQLKAPFANKDLSK